MLSIGCGEQMGLAKCICEVTIDVMIVREDHEEEDGARDAACENSSV